MHADLTPYPTLPEVLRAVGNILETSPSNRFLDEMIASGNCDYSKFKKNQTVIFRAWHRGDSPESMSLDRRIRDFGDLLLRDYVVFIREPSVAGFDRHQTVPMLLEIFLAPRLIEFLQPVMRELTGVELAHLLAHDQPVGFAFEWLAHKYPKEWGKYEAERHKEYAGRDDNLRGWKNGDHVPSFVNLLALLDDFAEKGFLNAENAQKIREVFFVARSLAALFRDTETYGFHSIMRARLFDSNRVVDPIQRLKDHYVGNLHSVVKQVEPLYELNDEISRRLFTQDARRAGDAVEIDELLVEAESLCLQLKNLNVMWWRTVRLRAVWFLCSGRQEEAMKEYKRLFDYIFYVGMEDLDQVYHEALVVAAILEDRVFLKQLKNLGMLFGRFDKPIDAQNSKASKHHKTPELEDWEVDQWGHEFEYYFPELLFFEGVKPVKSETKLKHGMLVFGPEDFELQLKDWRDPIKQLKNIRGKRVTALIYFTALGKVSEVAELLKMGADVNTLSSANDSALLLAIQRLDLPECGPPDLRLFEAVSSVQHDPATLNTPTDKKKLTVLGCAIDKQHAGTVEKVLKMGANPDLRCDTDQVTPLYKAIRSYSAPLGFGEVEQMLKTPSPEMLESIRRHAPWLAGMDHVTVAQNISKLLENSRHMQIGRELLASMPLADHGMLYAIAQLLLGKGADPNHPHAVNGWSGFTPLMLAAELNQAEVFKLLLDAGGNPNQKAHLQDGRSFDCRGIAIAHNSNGVLSMI